MTIERVKDPFDPRRCQAVIQNKGQCLNRASEGSNYCINHNGNFNRQAEESLTNYRLSKYQARLADKANSPALKSLRDEVAILRILLEEQINRCTDDTDLLLYSQPIAELVTKIEKCVVSTNKLEAALGETLDKATLMRFAGKVIDIISAEIQEEETINRISNNILDAMKAEEDADE